MTKVQFSFNTDKKTIIFDNKFALIFKACCFKFKVNIINKNSIEMAPAYKIIITNVKNLIFSIKKIIDVNRNSIINIKAEYIGFVVVIKHIQKKILRKVNVFKISKLNIICVYVAICNHRVEKKLSLEFLIH